MTGTVSHSRRPGQRQQREQSPAFLFYVNDWRGSLKVRAMSFATRGMFVELLLEQWRHGAVPASAADCARLIGGTTTEWTRAWPTLRVCFVPRKRDGLLVNPKLERVRQERRKYQKAQAESGLRGAHARWKKDSEPIGSPSKPMAKHSSSSSSALASTSSLSSASDLKEKDHSRINKHSRPSRLSPITQSAVNAFRKARE